MPQLVHTAGVRTGWLTPNPVYVRHRGLGWPMYFAEGHASFYLYKTFVTEGGLGVRCSSFIELNRGHYSNDGVFVYPDR